MTTSTKKNKPEYPSWICTACGNKYGSWPPGHLATFHEAYCGWCGEKAMVTEPRDFRYPAFPVEEKHED